MLDCAQLREDPDDREPGFAELYCGVAPALHVWASLRIRPQLRTFCEVEDLLQEIWCRAYAIRDRFVAEQIDFRPWVFRVAKNVLLEVVRKANYASKVSTPEGRTSKFLQLECVADRVTSITRRIARDDTLRAFHERVDALPVDDRELVLHIGLEGLDCAEVATQLGLKYETVKKRWQRLRAKLETLGLPDALLS